jgi:hypothetical protein
VILLLKEEFSAPVLRWLGLGKTQHVPMFLHHLLSLTFYEVEVQLLLVGAREDTACVNVSASLVLFDL